MDPNGQHDSDVEGAWPSLAPNQSRPPDAEVPRRRVNRARNEDTTDPALPTSSGIKEESAADEPRRGVKQERRDENPGTSQPTCSRIKEEPVDEVPENDKPPCEYTPRGSVAPRPAPSQFKPPRLETPSLDDVAPQIEDPLLSAHMQINLQQEEIDELKQQLERQEKEWTEKFENEQQKQKEKEKDLTLNFENKLLSLEAKYLKEISEKDQQIIELLKSQVHQNQQQPTMAVSQFMLPASQRSAPPGPAIPPQPAAPTPCPQSSIPAPRAPSIHDSSRKTSVAPRESSSELMEPPQKKMRRDEQNDREMDDQVKDGISQNDVRLDQERDAFDSNREDNLEDYEVADQPEKPQKQRSDERGDQRMEIGVPEMEELDLSNEQPVGDQEAIDFPYLREQPEQAEAAHEKPMEEDNDMGPLQNEGLELNGNEVENDQEMDDEEAQVQPAVGRRRSSRKKVPVSQIEVKYEKNHIKNQKQGEYKRYKALHGGSYRKWKRNRNVPTQRMHKLSDKIVCAKPALQQRVSLPSQLMF